MKVCTHPTYGNLHPDEAATAERCGAFMVAYTTTNPRQERMVSAWLAGRPRADRAAAFLADHGYRFRGPIVTTGGTRPILRVDFEPAHEPEEVEA